MTASDALQLLVELRASPWLVRHHELVLEAAVLLCDRVHKEFGLAFDRNRVLAGAALHDAGKIVHPDEQRASGHEHERAGRQLLLDRGVPEAIARFCVSHASWNTPDASIEDLLVALADTLWKGKRDDVLEQTLAKRIARDAQREMWAVFDALDSICESVAADGPSRLDRSRA